MGLSFNPVSLRLFKRDYQFNLEFLKGCFKFYYSTNNCVNEGIGMANI